MSSEPTIDADSELRSLLALSEAYDSEMLGLLEAAWNTSTRRLVVCMAFCKAAVVHGISQRVLIEEGLHGTALSLIRLHFEAVVRAAWILHAAKDDWLEKFTAPVPEGNLSEPQMGPPIPAMLDAVASVAPEAALELRRLNETVKVMHSFVHGGAYLVVHALRGYPPENLIAVIQNRNLLSLILANVLVIASGKSSLRNAVRDLASRHRSCMPPVRSA